MPAQAASFSLDADGLEPLYQTTLPKSIYQYSRQNRLKDLTVRNAEGEAVPYALVPYQSIHPKTKVTEQSKPLVIFPMQEDEIKRAGVTNIQLNALDRHTSVNVTSGDDKSISKTYYLFDLGKKHHAFKKLSLDWEGQEGKLLTVDVMTSEDLNHWSHVSDATLLKVTASEQTIVQNSVTFKQPINARYLQIRPQASTESLTLTAVNLEFNHVKEVTLPLAWQAIPFLQREQTSSETHIDFESTSRYPATHLTIDLPQQNTITHATIMTRDNKEQPWRTIKRTSLYRLNKNGQDYTNKPISIPNSTARYWRLSFAQTKGGIGNQNPQLRLGWVPDTLVWNARGSAPYAVQIGEPNSTSNSVSVSSLLKPYGSQKVQQLPMSKISLVAADQDFNAWDRPKDYKRLWLWGGLLLGVLALASMVYSLLKHNPKPAEK
jgi:hypothetical protein